MTKDQVDKYLENIGVEPKQRVQMPNGGIFLDNLLVKFSKEVEDRVLGEVVGNIRKFRKENR